MGKMVNKIMKIGITFACIFVFMVFLQYVEDLHNKTKTELVESELKKWKKVAKKHNVEDISIGAGIIITDLPTYMFTYYPKSSRRIYAEKWYGLYDEKYNLVVLDSVKAFEDYITLKTTLYHELGHVKGLVHTCNDCKDIMSASYNKEYKPTIYKYFKHWDEACIKYFNRIKKHQDVKRQEKEKRGF
jgi:hypothetical protein